MEITTLQIVLVFIVACIAGMGSILDEFQFHRPLIACTLVGIVLGDMKTGIIIYHSGYRRSSEHWCRYRTGNPSGRCGPGTDHHRSYYYRCFPARCG